MTENVFHSVFPYNGEMIATFPVMQHAEIENKLHRAERAFAHWRSTPFQLRSDHMLRLAELLEKNKKECATLITSEMGKVLREAEAEVVKCASVCRYYAENAGAMLAQETLRSPGIDGYISYTPKGAIFGIMPWNFPFWQVIRFAIPAIMGGNVVLLKHAPNVCGCSLAIEKLFREAGFPEGIFQSLIFDIGATEQVIAHPAVQGVTLTGSAKAGAAVAALSGKYIKPIVLELGGSDAFIVLKDADLPAAIRTAVKSRFQNAGQSCIAAKRIIIEEPVFKEFEQGFITSVERLHQGDPFDKDTHIGPMARMDLAAQLSDQQSRTLALGAGMLTGGNREGCNYQPTVLADIPRDAPGYREELFGPLATLFRAKDVQTAVDIANDTRFGLGATIFSGDVALAHRLADGLQAGMVAINTLLRSSAEIPFGGVRQSGFGRELGKPGLLSFMDSRSVIADD